MVRVYCARCVTLVLIGPEAGLRLTINLEQYENIPSSDTDSGIKVSE